MCKADCKCQKFGPTVNLSPTEISYKSIDGTSYMVVPLVMARADVVMNEAHLSEGEMHAESWNGVPLTVGHPTAEGGEAFLSANSPDVLSEWCVGRIFNVRVEEGVMKAEGWVDIGKANAIDVGLIGKLKSFKMDVSTGYFADFEPETGELNGRAFKFVQKNVRPDHLALLPNEVGACSWADGCGVRTNRRLQMKDVKNAFLALAKQLGFSVNAKDITPNQEPASVDEDPEEDDKEPMMNAEEVKKFVTEAIANAIKTIAPKQVELSADDKAALDFARNSVSDHRKALVTKIVGNSSMTEEQLKAMDTSTLETIANGLKPTVIVADYSGRAAANEQRGDDAEALAMEGQGVIHLIRNRNKKEAA